MTWQEPLTWIVRLLAAWVVVGTALPLVRRDAWWIRACEFPRVQLLAGAGIALALTPLSEPEGGVRAAMAGACALAALLQAARILPFTPFWPRRDSVQIAEGGATLGLLVANVLMTNRAADRLLAFVESQEPDLVLVVEADRWWQEALARLRAVYPHTIEHPRDNTYGMLLYSRHPLEREQVRFLVERDVPSIRCTVAIPGGARLDFWGLHPRPPAPREASETTERDAELLLVAREVRESSGPALVAGDLNDVAWSYTTRLFRRISGLLDPRIGRRLLATFPADRWWLRFPLDHIFHSTELGLVELRLGPAWGSDHLPMLGRFRLGPVAGALQEEPRPKPGDQELARRKIGQGVEGDARGGS